MLKIENVRQSFRSGFWLKKTEILHGISFEVPKGSIYGFLGPNGAGKTTLIHLITGIKRPVAGNITLSGSPTDAQEARRKIGYLPERPYFYSHLTGAELLGFFGALSGLSKEDVQSRIPNILEEVGMSHARDLELKKYSKGMLQRIGIAQALIHDPEFLVLDEPMSGLDPVGRKEIRELILKLSKNGKTIFFSTHVIPDVEAICDRVAIIRKGTLLGAGPIQDFLRQQDEKGFEIFLENILDANQIAKMHPGAESRITPSGTYMKVPDEEGMERALKSAFELKIRIHSVNPVRRSLEDYFEEKEKGART